MNQLDRIEAKLNIILELLLIEPFFIQAPHAKRPKNEWEKADKLRQKSIKKLKHVSIHENSNNTTSESD